MNKSAIINALFELGFKIDDFGAHGCMFKYEDLGFLYNPEQDDEDFFRISAPCIYQMEDEESRPVILEVINEVNYRIKYTKTMLVNDNVWVSYEARLFDGIDPEEIVRCAILLVRATVNMFHSKVNGEDEADEQDNDESNNENEE